MQAIQLPTSTDQLLDQLFVHYNFTKNFDVKHPGPAAHYPQFLATFDKEAELDRLADIADVLSAGGKTLQFT